MRLTYRSTQLTDLKACLPFIRDRFLHDQNSQKNLLALWSHLIENDSCISFVIEDRDQPNEKRQVGFGFSLFATESFIRQVKTDLPPFLSLRVLERWKRGIRPFLRRDEIPKANSKEGVNVIALHYGWDDRRYEMKDFAKIRQLLPEAFLGTHCGYQIKELLNEVYGTDAKDTLSNVGCSLYRDYAEHTGTKHFPKSSPQTHPYLMGFKAGVFTERMGTYVAAALLKYSSPRFHFSSGEQQILQQALVGETDEEIAKNRDISTSTVKKRWQTIYDKVMAVDPDLLMDAPALETPDKVKVKQRRRYLLNYLRDHPEELRPVSAPHHRKKDRRRSNAIKN